MSEKKENKKVYPIYEMKKHGKLYLPPSFITQLNYLHGHAGDTEWSGLLFYDIRNGNVSDPENFILDVKDLFLMDIGTAGYTEYETDGDIIDFYDAKEKAMEWKMGHVHSHHTMTTFFSSTDMDELYSNVDKYNYYLSLIVNFSGRYSAKVAFLSDIKTHSELQFNDESGKIIPFKLEETEKTMIIINMDIYYDYVDPIFYKRYKDIQEKEEIAKKKKEKEFQRYQYDSYNTDGWRIPKSRIKKDEDIDPYQMTDTQVEQLTRNILSVSPDLDEMRSSLVVLNVLANSKEADLEFYYKWLAENIELIIENYFDQSLEVDEMNEVLKEILGSLIRYDNYSRLTSILEGISEIITQFSIAYKEMKDEEDEAEQLEEEALRTEIELIN